MTQVYNGLNRGGLINYVVIDDLKQLEFWGPRFELTNFVELDSYLNAGLSEGSSALVAGRHRAERAMLMPAQVELPTTFYSLLDWDKIVEGAIASDQPAWIYAYQQARIPSIMNFVPTKVMLFTENSVLPFRDYDGQQSKFIAEVLGKENIHGDYRLINAIPPLKVVVLKAHGDQR